MGILVEPMKEVSFLPVDHSLVANYIALGKQSYEQHYLHLWEQGDPISFFNTYLSEKVVQDLVEHPGAFPHIILYKDRPMGILNVSVLEEVAKRKLLLDKIYILREFTGNQVGTTALSFIEDVAQRLNLGQIMLYAMKKGKPFLFYQRHGFKIIGETEIALPHVLHSEKEMWVMEKTIASPTLAQP
jgi:diamine N-acetyltransferase